MRTLAGLCLTLALALSLSPAAPASAAEFNFTYSCFFPPTHIQAKLADEWCKAVEERTGGRVHVDFYPGNTLTKATESYEGVVQGISDLAFSALGYTRGRFPVMSAVDLPLGYASGVSATAAAQAVFEKFQPAEFGDTEVMYFNAHGPGQLHTKGTAVKSLEDLKGLKIRATGNSAKVVQALGATPIAQSMPDAYQSIQKGMVDGGMYPIETNKGWKMAEVVDYCTEATPIAYTTTFFVVMNKAKWAALPPDIQQTIRGLNAEWAMKHAKAWDESDAEGRAFFLAQGNSFVTLAPAEMQRWEAAVAPIIDEYAAELDAKGVDGKAVIATIREAVAKNQ
ncbi:MAG: TRAP transporter substrate-binding protein [Desulfovibrionaceae bacterium]